MGSQQLCLHLYGGRLDSCACTCAGERLPTAVPVPVQGEARQLCLHLCTGAAPNSCDCTCAGGDSRQLCLHLCRARLSIVVLAPVREVGGSQKLCLHLCGERLDSCACTCTGRDSQQLCLHLCRARLSTAVLAPVQERGSQQLCLHLCGGGGRGQLLQLCLTKGTSGPWDSTPHRDVVLSPQATPQASFRPEERRLTVMNPTGVGAPGTSKAMPPTLLPGPHARPDLPRVWQ